MSFASRHRDRLRALLLQKGEDHPTLCEGWNNRDMAVHLYLRETSPRAAVGMFVPAFKSQLEAEETKLATTAFEQIVEKWGRGPKGLHPAKLFDPLMNAAEHFVHAEDVRRGAWEAAALSQHLAEEGYGTFDEDEQSLDKILKYFGKGMLVASKGAVVFEVTAARPINVVDKRGVSKDGQDVARVKGHAGEILLWLFGRDMSEVEVHDPRQVIRKTSM